MSETPAVYETKNSALGEVTITPEQVSLIKNTIAVGATDDELKLFFFECRRRGVHPLDRLIHFVKRSGRATFQCGIDFMRAQAEASGQYRGQEDVEYGPNKNGYPEWAKATVRRIDPNTGDVYTVSATAYWDEFYPGEQLGFMWKKMPRVMLGKVAESQALRKAFPINFNGLYTFEEMQQADLVASGTPKQQPVKQPQSKSQQADKGNGHSVNDPDAPITENQLKAIHVLLDKLKVADNLKHAYIADALQLEEEPETLKSLTKGQGSTAIERLNLLIKGIEHNAN